MKEIYEIESLAKLEKHLRSLPAAATRKKLLKLFLKNAIYKNVTQWNQAVRICEALAIVGWGDHVPVEATKGMFFNGQAETQFYDRNHKLHYLDGTWSKRKAGLVLDPKMTSVALCPGIKKPTKASLKLGDDIEDGKLLQQRNWIPKNPIVVGYMIRNCYPKSEALLKHLDKLLKTLNKKMRPEVYGTALNQLYVSVNLSYPVPGCSGSNYIILEEEGSFSNDKLYKMLRKKFSAKVIEENGYWLRQRYKYGGFRKAKGEMSAEIFFPKEFSDQTLLKQKKELAARVLEVVSTVSEKLAAKKIEYDFETLSADLQKVINGWVKVKA